MINELIQIISEEALLFESFLQLLDQQKEMLVANDVDGLNDVTQQQQQKFLQSQELNRRREKTIAAIRESNAIDGDLTVTRLLDFADEDQATRLRSLRQVILELNERIAEARNTNAVLLTHSREFVSRTMTMLSRLNKSDNSYAASGEATQASASLALDRRV